MKLVLFDVDMTLISSAGAGARALDAAMVELYGIAEAFRGVEFAGRTDRLITEDGLRRGGVEPTPGAVSGMRCAYLRHLARELSSDGCAAEALPGVPELLSSLEERGAAIGLLTGNWKEGAFLKLAACGLDGRFLFGGFADDGRERTDLVPRAVEGARLLTGVTFAPTDTWVVGDTPHDVSCGRAWGFETLAVATGPYDAERLAASGASGVVPDLKDTAYISGLVTGDRRA